MASSLPAGLFLAPYADLAVIASESCLADHFHGIYGSWEETIGLFAPTADCALEAFSRPEEDITLSGNYLSRESQELVWLEHKAVEPSLWTTLKRDELFDFVVKLRQPASSWIAPTDITEGSQNVFTAPGMAQEVEVLYTTGGGDFATGALISVNAETARVIDTILPRFWKSSIIPRTPTKYRPVPSIAVEHIRGVLAGLKHSDEVAAIVSNISVPQMYNDIQFLTGEDGKSGIESRHSFSSGSRTAAAWLKERFEDTGATCELRSFLIGYAPNVICRYPSTETTTSTVLLSAHYDSRGSFGNSRAPGGDDDGSGTTALLAIARTIKRKGITFRSNVELVAFAGEEQGLYGSKGYSRDLRAANANLTLMIQADMLAYRKPGEPPQLGLPQSIGTPEATQLVANVSALYSPELTVGITSACCSDHQSFHEQGFPATQVFERAGWIADPMYHNSGDLSDREGYDLDQVKSIAKVQFATLLHTAGYDVAA